jgi:hypothetical protein
MPEEEEQEPDREAIWKGLGELVRFNGRAMGRD